MKNIKCRIIEYVIIALVFGLIYGLIEILFKGIVHNKWETHYSMVLVSAISSLIIGAYNEIISWDTPIWKQSIFGGIVITVFELCAGLIWNQDYSIWDYRGMFLSYRGQICIIFSLTWCLLSIIIILLDDWIKYRLFNEEKPHYEWL